jgi:hypothetical protein
VFSVLGVPDEASWPGVAVLPHYPLILHWQEAG